MQKFGTTDESPDPGPSNRTDNLIVSNERSQAYGQSKTPLHIPLDKYDPDLSDANRAANGITEEAAVYKQLGNNGLMPMFFSIVGGIASGLSTSKWLVGTRSRYNYSHGMAGAATSFLLNDTGNLPHSTGPESAGYPVTVGSTPGVDGVPVDSDLEATYVELIDATTGNPLVVLGGPDTGKRVYGRTRVGVSISPNSVEIGLYFKNFSDDPKTVTGSVYSWEGGQPSVLNVFYGFRKSISGLDTSMFRRVFR